MITDAFVPATAAQSTAVKYGSRFREWSDMAATKWLFRLLCLFLWSQIFLIPIAAIGPWSFWPRISDVVFVGILIFWLFVPKHTGERNISSRAFAKGLWLVLVLTGLSFLGATVLVNSVQVYDFWTLPSFGFGLYGMVRLIQFVLLAQIVTTVPINEQRRRTIHSIMSLAVVIVTGTCLATFSSVITTADLSSWLPTGPSAGAWWAYDRRVGQGLGAIGYNHGYVAAQILLLLALALQLQYKNRPWLKYVFVIAAGVGIFVSGSRSGLLSFTIFVIAMLWTRPLAERLLSTAFGALAGGISILLFGFGPEDDEVASIIERQLTAFQFTDASNLSGRANIWDATLDAFWSGSPPQWLIGQGFGSTMDVGGAAHSLPLTYLTEFGILGFLLLSWLLILLLRKLATIEMNGSPLFWASVALLVGSFSQETFYPATWNGHFLGFYFVAVIITMNVRDATSNMNDRTPNQLRPWR